MTRRLPLMLILACQFNMAVAAEVFTRVIDQTDWPAYENGANILALEQVSSIVNRFVEEDRVRIEVRYQGGESALQWAQSCASWLVAFGIPSASIELLSASGSGNQLVLSIVDRR